jgi:uncharacterized protein YbjT (DUF2867 family)
MRARRHWGVTDDATVSLEIGYIGGSVLARLLAHPSKDTFAITALVRSEEKAKKLESFGVTPVVGSYKDVALVERLAEQAHVIFSCVCIRYWF